MKILFITSSRIGDAALSTGLLEYIAHEYPSAKVTICCGPLAASLFEGYPLLEEVIPLRKQKNNKHWVELWKRVVRTRWDMVVDLRDSAVSRLIFARRRFMKGRHVDRGAHKVIQNAEIMKLEEVPNPKLWFTKRQDEEACALLSVLHNASLIGGEGGNPACEDQGGDFVEGAGQGLTGRGGELVCRDGNFIEGAGVGSVEGRGRDAILAVGPSANWAAKTWPAACFIEVVQWMISEEGLLPGARVAVFAAKGEEIAAGQVLDSIPEGQGIDMIAKTDPGTAAAALARCDFYIGNDSGLMHLAAAAQVPTLGLFGPSYPEIYRPWGLHAAHVATKESFDELIDYEGYTPGTAPCLMESLSVEMVIKALQNPLWEKFLTP